MTHSCQLKRNRSAAIVALWALTWLFGGADIAAAQSTNQGPVLTILEENDLVVHTDRHYTQGIKLAYFHKDNFLPLGAKTVYEWLPEWGFTKQVGKFGYEVGQNMYTPADISTPVLQTNDRPYAGWLYTGFILHRRGVTGAAEWPTLESFELELGVIGPWSLARDAQTWVHQLRGFGLPQGWDNQIQNEPGIALRYERAVRWTCLALHPFDLEFIPHAGFSLGNVDTSLRIGGMVRAGFFLPDDYGNQTIDSLVTSAGGWSPTQVGSRWGAYVFAASEGKYVIHNAFLDGNLFYDSYSVDKQDLVGDFKTGFVVILDFRRSWLFHITGIEAGYTYVFRTPEFHGQTENDEFGSVFLKFKF
jgi:hypothetical protein